MTEFFHRPAIAEIAHFCMTPPSKNYFEFAAQPSPGCFYCERAELIHVFPRKKRIACIRVRYKTIPHSRGRLCRKLFLDTLLRTPQGRSFFHCRVGRVQRGPPRIAKKPRKWWASQSFGPPYRFAQFRKLIGPEEPPKKPLLSTIRNVPCFAPLEMSRYFGVVCIMKGGGCFAGRA
jgi:hypothetical protein